MQIPLKVPYKNTDGKMLTKNNRPFLEGEELQAALDEIQKVNETITDEKKKQKFVNGEILTLRDVLIVSVSTEFPEDQKDHAKMVDEKLRRFAIYSDLQDTTAETEFLEMTPETIVYMRPRVARAFSMIVAGPTLKILDSGSAPKKT